MPAARFRRSLLLAVLGSLVLCAPARSAPAPPFPPLFFGVAPQADRPQSEYFTMKAHGVDSVRFGIPWSAVEQSPGHYDFTAVDPFVERTARAGLEAFPFLGATPISYGVDCTAADCFTSLPVQNQQQIDGWSAYVRATVRRYGPGGSFWAQNPGIPYHPIRIWQIWNEENFFYFTKPRSPELYAKLVKISHDVIKSEDPGAEIVLGGLFGHPRQQPPQAYQAADFLDGIYQQPGIKDDFDAVALHPYALDASKLDDDIEEIRQVMASHDDAQAGLYITEMGWGSAPTTDNGFEKGPEGQLRELREAFTILGKVQRKARVRRVFWFSWDDHNGTCVYCDSTGLVTEGGQPKPALDAFTDFAGCFGKVTTLLGGDAADTLRGTPGPDVIVGGGGDDQIQGLGGDDRICGEDGNDTITGASGEDFVLGGPGADRLTTRGGADFVLGDLGDDRISAGAGGDRVLGDLGADRILGSGGTDVLFGDAGDDFLLAGNGNDKLFGGLGNDNLFGGLGNDNLFGNKGNDRLFGNPGKDRLFGQAGSDFLNGGPGKDVLKPGKGKDEVRQ